MSEHTALRKLIVGDGETRIDSWDAADRILASGWSSPDDIAALTARLEAAEAAAVVDSAMVERAVKAYNAEFNQTNVAYKRPMLAALRAAITPPATETPDAD